MGAAKIQEDLLECVTVQNLQADVMMCLQTVMDHHIMEQIIQDCQAHHEPGAARHVLARQNFKWLAADAARKYGARSDLSQTGFMFLTKPGLMLNRNQLPWLELMQQIAA